MAEEVTNTTARKSNEPEIIKVRDHYELAGAAADWFHQNGEAIPQWYTDFSLRQSLP